MSGILSSIATNYAVSSAFPTAQVLVVAGGGAGGDLTGGGGGAGGVLYDSAYVITDNTLYTVTVGAGGTSGSYPSRGGNGGNSVFGTLTAVGGGGGGPNGTTGATGGSGGGGGGGTGGDGNTGGSGTASQGYAGGNGYTIGVQGGGGGGGAGGVGANGTGGSGGVGGDGIQNSISGTPTYYGGGGGGGTYFGGTLGTGGLGGGGDAGASDNGTDGLGGGGGGSKDNGNFDGNGGSGVVIISYVTGAMTATGGTITTSGGNTIHTFTSSGSFTVGTPTVTYATWNPADISADIELTNSNLTARLTATGPGQYRGARATIGKSSGKWYWEVKGWHTGGGSVNGIGQITESLTHSNGVGGANGWGVRLYQTYGDKQHNDSFSAFGNGTYADANTITGYALDMDNLTLDIYQDGVSLGKAFDLHAGTVYPMLGLWDGTSVNYIANFGASPFTYTPPAGYNSGVYV